ncbi:MAG: ribosome-associated translation inhibitor RaiA [Candidatus Taylorbacteria bacterium]
MLRIQIKATNTSLTPAIKEYVEKKIGSLERMIKPDDTSALADVEIEKTTNHHKDGEELFRAEVNLRVGKAYFRAEASNFDLYAAIDFLKDEMHRELSVNKRKTIHMIRKGGQAIKNIIKGFSRFKKK